MLDIRPKIGVSGDFVKQYKSKRFGNFRPSKYPIITISPDGSYNCRETLGHRTKDLISDNTYNSKAEGNPYQLIPLIAMNIKGKVYYSRFSPASILLYNGYFAYSY